MGAICDPCHARHHRRQDTLIQRTADEWFEINIDPGQSCPSYWLCYRHNNQIFVVIEPGASLIHARMRASLDGLDQGEFTEGHELDRK
jgi:hypothetical protein